MNKIVLFSLSLLSSAAFAGGPTTSQIKSTYAKPLMTGKNLTTASIQLTGDALGTYKSMQASGGTVSIATLAGRRSATGLQIEQDTAAIIRTSQDGLDAAIVDRSGQTASTVRLKGYQNPGDAKITWSK